MLGWGEREKFKLSKMNTIKFQSRYLKGGEELNRETGGGERAFQVKETAWSR